MLKSKNLSSILRSNAGIFTAFALFLIMLLGLALRSYRLDQSPYGALVDELHFGYIAHSLNTTGADEHGVSWPLVFKGFGDQKLPAYAYLLMPVVRWLGLSVQSIRWPSVVSGTILIGLIFWLARALKFSRVLGLAAAFLTAVSPWTFWLSRFGLESNLGLTSWTAGLISLSTIKDKHSDFRLALTGLLFALTWYCYIAYRPISLAILILYLGFHFFYKSLSKRSIIVIFGTFLLAILPLLLLSPGSSNTARLNQIGIFSDPGLAMRINEKRAYCSKFIPYQICYLSWNKPLLTTQTIITNYFKTFSAEYLVINGEIDHGYATVDNFGQFMPIIYPFFFIGLFELLKRNSNHLLPMNRFLILIGLLFTVLPSALSGEPQKIRLSAAYPFFVIIIIFGISSAKEIILSLERSVLRNYKYWRITILTLIVISTTSLFAINSIQYYLDYYFIHTQKKDILYNSYVRDLMTYSSQFAKSHDIFIRASFSDPVMHYAFYTKLDPHTYQDTVRLGSLEKSGFQHAVSVDNFYIVNSHLPDIACQALIRNKPSIFITDEVLDKSFKPLRTFTSADGVYTYAHVYDALEFAQINRLQCTNESQIIAN